MNTDKAIGAIVVSGLAVLCCAGPALVATVGAAALSAWALAAGAAAVALAVALIGLGALWVRRHNRPDQSAGADCCAAEGVEGKAQSNRHPGRSARLPSFSTRDA